MKMIAACQVVAIGILHLINMCMIHWFQIFMEQISVISTMEVKDNTMDSA